MNQYIYSGPVQRFDGFVISNSWNAITFAKTEKKARNNFAYQFKKQNNLLPCANIKLPGKIDLVI
jgi:hypothetical protein